MRITNWAFAALALLSSGCSHFTTYQADIGTPTTGVSFDAKQRLMLVNPSPVGGGARRICTEPSPDALASIGASIGASFFSQPGASKSLAAALGESAGSIGLRTTSIQLMRDAMYRACESYLSGGIDGDGYANLQAHAQNLVVGLLAIEQLTGAVQAQQVALLSNASAGGLPDVAAEASNLTQAKEATQAQQVVAQTERRKADAAKALLSEKQAAHDKAKADTAAKAEDVAALKKEVDEQTPKTQDAEDAAKAADDLLQIRADAQKVAQEEFDVARSRVRASVTSEARFGDSFRRGNMSDKVAEVVTKGIVDIVGSVMGQSIAAQRCLIIITGKGYGEMGTVQQAAVDKVCNEVSVRELQRQTQTRLLK